ncbi:hypothetical protein CK203_058989 [Vitis vinifera]|uniref:Uncharacterized protein n=1 Tax=Vitis vinifera TaxID=29760 RepID=A0A438GEP7_VITVI|nr:hypothetical protein CK203_058989 [Vitis vinifera]
MMEEVVANEGGETTDEITFYILQHMELLYLPNLTSFSSGGYIFSFPSLEQMLVKECPKMKCSLQASSKNLFSETANGNVEAEIVELGAGSAL